MTIEDTRCRGYGLHYKCWHLPTIEHINRDETLGAVMDEEWQKLRKTMKHTSTFTKMCMLEQYWRVQEHSGNETAVRLAKIRIINYLTALKRGGQLDRGGNIQR